MNEGASKFDIVKYRGDGVNAPPDAVTCIFARSNDGMVVGSVQNDVGRFGEDPNSAVMRAFLDHESAIRWLKQQCREMAGREDVDFVERSAEPRIVMPRGPVLNQRKM